MMRALCKAFTELISKATCALLTLSGELPTTYTELIYNILLRYEPTVTFAISMLAYIAADTILMLSGYYPWTVFASLTFMGVKMGL
jgi:hypothetical protein